MSTFTSILDDLQHTVLLFDIDGTLSPIVPDPAAATVPQGTLDGLAAARETCALVGCVTGRDLAQATRMVPLPGIWIAASHGMHIRRGDGSEDVDPVATAARPQLDLAVTMAKTVGWTFEDKGFSVTLHFRHTATPELTARQMRAQITTVLDPTVVELVDARKALEIRPLGARTKADAVRAAVSDAPGEVRRVVYVGDDTTDLDAFAALHDSGFEGVRVAVRSDEVPPALLEAADVVLGGQHEVPELLHAAAGSAR